jgi:hypothetical protein
MVLEIRVEGDQRNVVHKNLVLVRAGSAEEAYTKALSLGRENSISYENPSRKKVEIQFQGLSKLTAVNDRLEDGAELSYEEFVDVPEEKIREWVVPKHLLRAFRGIEPSRGPSYSSVEILERASRMIR